MSDFNSQVIAEFRQNDGTVTTAGFGRSLILVHHVGARSGTERVTPLVPVRDSEDTWLVAASKAGAPDNPAWYHNLLAHPDVTIETPDDGVVDVHVTELTGDDRDTAWRKFTDMSDGFRSYEERTTRTIPVLALTRR
ncbi:nitroreductase/quinone reductase family protein [Nocardioides sp. CFH 31398]|uniref:nitroreductase/quinone reductase family protein n=1 Tax=Nocardioides sp. CFH 31398 TaxID=2919579 RepID=UPI001F06E372|nr:nitroreductase/quinone reductase family protein [Nocardioides sp. CFH 31398]MCH1866187.1 nitroreductase family deazaflavin-dependent oxidoreductase [Nocardioides sp. CFH 31398]